MGDREYNPLDDETNFCNVPISLYAVLGISQTARHVYGYLLAFMGRGEAVDPTIQMICRALRISKRWAIKSLKSLKDEGLIEAIPSGGKRVRYIFHPIKAAASYGEQMDTKTHGEHMITNKPHGEQMITKEHGEQMDTIANENVKENCTSGANKSVVKSDGCAGSSPPMVNKWSPRKNATYGEQMDTTKPQYGEQMVTKDMCVDSPMVNKWSPRQKEKEREKNKERKRTKKKENKKEKEKEKILRPHARVYKPENSPSSSQAPGSPPPEVELPGQPGFISRWDREEKPREVRRNDEKPPEAENHILVQPQYSRPDLTTDISRDEIAKVGILGRVVAKACEKTNVTPSEEKRQRMLRGQDALKKYTLLFASGKTEVCQRVLDMYQDETGIKKPLPATSDDAFFDAVGDERFNGFLAGYFGL